MAFFKIKDCDTAILEEEILRELKKRTLPFESDLKLIEYVGQRRSSVTQLLKQTEQERARLEFELNFRIKHIETMEKTLSWRITKPLRIMKAFFGKKS